MSLFTQKRPAFHKCIQKTARRTPTEPERKRYRSNSPTHTIKDFPHTDIVCYRCGVEGHWHHQSEVEYREMYGDYIYDIRERKSHVVG